MEVVRHRGAAAVIPLLDDGTVIFVRQYRYTTGGWLLEIPAGKLDGGESPETCARREVEEEVGYRAAHLESLGWIWATPASPTRRSTSSSPPAWSRPPSGWRRTRSSTSSASPSRRPSSWPRTGTSTTRSRSAPCSGWPGCAGSRADLHPSAWRGGAAASSGALVLREKAELASRGASESGEGAASSGEGRASACRGDPTASAGRLRLRQGAASASRGRSVAGSGGSQPQRFRRLIRRHQDASIPPSPIPRRRRAL